MPFLSYSPYGCAIKTDVINFMEHRPPVASTPPDINMARTRYRSVFYKAINKMSRKEKLFSSSRIIPIESRHGDRTCFPCKTEIIRSKNYSTDSWSSAAGRNRSIFAFFFRLSIYFPASAPAFARFRYGESLSLISSYLLMTSGFLSPACIR